MDKEEMIDVELRLGKDLADKINKKTKAELLGDLTVMILRNRVQDETVEKLEINVSLLEKKLIKFEHHINQSKHMIESVMRDWK